MKERSVIKKIIDVIGNIEDATIISNYDFTDERTANMIVVGIDQVEQLNINLPDYRYLVNITIDCFIEDDKDGSTFEFIVNTVKDKINNYINKNASLESAFQELPVVGWLNLNVENSITTESNRAVITSEVIASYNN